MKYIAETEILRDSRECTVRNAEISDAPELIDYLKKVSSQSRYLVREENETDLTLKQEEEFILSRLNSENSLMLVACIDGKIIGTCSIGPVSSLSRFSHRCTVGIAVFKEYCGLGIGSLLMQKALKAAESCGFEQAELEVVSTNKPAIALYKKCGFTSYGERPYAMKYADGTYANELLMIKML